MKSREAYDKNSNIHENEIAYKRFDKNGNAIKPDYIIYFSDSPDELLFEKSIIAAKEFNIPIVMVSKTKWYKYMGEKQNIPQGSISK